MKSKSEAPPQSTYLPDIPNSSKVISITRSNKRFSQCKPVATQANDSETHLIYRNQEATTFNNYMFIKSYAFNTKPNSDAKNKSRYNNKKYVPMRSTNIDQFKNTVHLQQAYRKVSNVEMGNSRLDTFRREETLRECEKCCDLNAKVLLLSDQLT